ncbi:MAG: hypothetical protein DHS20C15_34730 [Planctomycetota bacterium]|nr:MAG: hypothetical protein DHS20C15_34730 [Planctomycetota bacterium]
MKTLLHRSVLATSLALVVACGGSESSADSGASPAEVKASVATMEVAELESSRDDTQTEIKSVEQQIKDLGAKIADKVKESGGDALGGVADSLMGEGSADKAVADAKDVIAKLEAEKDNLETLLKDLKAKFDIYVAEIKARAAG